MKNNKILILSNYDQGLYDFRREVLQAFVEEGLEVLVSAPDTGYCDKLAALGCTMIPTELDRRGMNPVKDGKLFLFYMRLMKKHRPGAVLTYTIKPNVYGGVAAALSGIPCLPNVTGLGTSLENGGMKQKLILTLYRLGLKNAACVFFQNEDNLAFMKKHGCSGKKECLLPGSGVNLTEHAFCAYPEGEQVIFLSLFRLMKDKGIEELLTAAEKIHAEYPQTVFRLLGSYEEENRAQYEPWVNRLVQEGVLEYYGFRKDAARFMEEAGAIVHPSYHEGMSNVLLEAAATGRPVLASDVPGCRETMKDGVTGIAFAPKSAEALEGALKSFLRMTPGERSAMGRAGRRLVEEKFDRRKVINAYLKELKEVL